MSLERPLSRPLLIVTVVALAALLGGLAVIAYQGIFSLLIPVDDEGYVIVSLREFLAGAAPYEEVQSQYGPGLFTFVGAPLDLLGVPLSTDGARFFNLALWLGSSALAAVTLLRLTRSPALAAGGLLVTFYVLTVDANEPLHPGATVAFLLTAIAAAAAFLEPARPRAGMIAIGALVGAILSIKVNVGGLAVISILTAGALFHLPRRRALALRIVLTVVFVATPLVLLASRFEDPGTLRYGVAVAAGALGLVAVGLRVPGGERPGPTGLLLFGGGVVAALLAASLGPLLAGTSPAGLVEGWILDPARMPDLAFAPLLLQPWAPAWAATGLALAAGLAWRLGGQPIVGWQRRLLGAFRIAVGVGIWLVLAGPVLGLPGPGLAVATPFAWVAALPAREPRFARLLICALAILQALHAFPVAGSQIGWSEFLFVIVGGLCVADGIGDLIAVEALGVSARGWQLLGNGAAALFILLFSLNPLRDYAAEATSRFEASAPLALPGAQRTRVPADRVAQLHDVVGGLERRCETFLTMPGLNSLYLYTEQRPPVVLNGPWPFFFQADEQRAILAEARRLPSLCVVRKPDALQFWQGFAGVRVPERPLVRFVRERFTAVRDYSGYILAVRRAGRAGRGS